MYINQIFNQLINVIKKSFFWQRLYSSWTIESNKCDISKSFQDTVYAIIANYVYICNTKKQENRGQTNYFADNFSSVFNLYLFHPALQCNTYSALNLIYINSSNNK